VSVSADSDCLAISSPSACLLNIVGSHEEEKKDEPEFKTETVTVTPAAESFHSASSVKLSKATKKRLERKEKRKELKKDKKSLEADIAQLSSMAPTEAIRGQVAEYTVEISKYEKALTHKCITRAQANEFGAYLEKIRITKNAMEKELKRRNQNLRDPSCM